MAKAMPSEPRCPECGYAILGVRDMRCPECGRVLDVRDFNPDASSRDSHRYERNSALGGLVACILVAILLLGVGVVLAAGVRVGFLPLPMLLIALVLAVWMIAALTGTGQNLWSWFKSSRKRR